MDLFPKVFRTEGDLAEFESSRIFDSIIKETGMSEANANKITELVVRRIISSGIKFLSGPHIREIVCSILSEQHFENERKLYTRIGIPLMDYEKILESGFDEHPKKIINPEKIHNRAANRISEEYAHLKILTSEESAAHLSGDLHIHKLRYFDLRPLTQIWDPRMILENGIPPIKNFIPCCKLKPANNLKQAIHHLVKWLALTQNEFCGNQGYEHLIMCLSPFIKDVKDSDLISAMKNFLYELNHLSFLTGSTISSSSIQTGPTVFEPFLQVPIISNTRAKYGDYSEECLKLFNALTIAFNKGDDNNHPFNTPKHEVLLNKKWLDEFNEVYLNIWNEINTMRTPLLVNSNINPLTNKEIELITSAGYINSGILQEVCLNLPRYAYTSKDEGNFLETISINMEISSQILLKKYEIIKKRLKSKHLPLCGGIINEKLLYNLNDQQLSISFIGLNEAVKFLTDFELHEDTDAFNLGKKILSKMNQLCLEFSRKNNKLYVLSENVSKKTPFRFANLDLKHFPKIAIPQASEGTFYYTNSTHFKKNAEIDLLERVKKQEEYQFFIQNGAIEYISLNDIKRNNLTLVDFINNAFLPSKLVRLKFIS
ncbi:MAG: anaerobic ribonucleoside-triphosphate reductase [Candidatus Thorarchaeota archaeon]